MLGDRTVIGFVPTRNFDTARRFYSDTLGLHLVKDDGFALVYQAGGNMLRVVEAPGFEPQPFTILGWEVDDVPGTAAALAHVGVEMKRFSFMDQDRHGVWTAPNGDQVAWFNDPDGNTLSISHHV